MSFILSDIVWRFLQPDYSNKICHTFQAVFELVDIKNQTLLFTC